MITSMILVSLGLIGGVIFLVVVFRKRQKYPPPHESQYDIWADEMGPIPRLQPELSGKVLCIFDSWGMCGHDCGTPFQPCHREEGHDGPCAHKLVRIPYFP